MRFWWTQQPARQTRQTVHSRPRVAQAVEAARQVGEMMPVSLGSARIDSVALQGMETVAALRHFDAVQRAAISGPLHKAQRRAQRGLATELIWATARAAKQTGRQPEEVWAEALRDWLASRETVAAPAPGPHNFEARRQQAWLDIEDTLAGLRAS